MVQHPACWQPGMPELCMAHHLSQLLSELVEREYTNLLTFPENLSGVRPAGDDSWSPKEELGHLIDSAANNHVRFVRASIEPEFHGPSYAQNDWVRLHGYQEMEWDTIINFWLEFNAFLTVLIARIPDAKLQTLCSVGSDPAVTLQFLVEDYMLHMQHHLDHLLGRERVTPYPAIQK
jgi:hypothetical protein